MFNVQLRRMCTLLLLYRMFCLCLLGLFVYSVVQIYCFLIDYLNDLFVESGIFKSATITVFWFISPFRSVSCCFIYLGALILGTHIFIIVIYYWWIDSFIIMSWPSLFLFIIFSLKSVFFCYYLPLIFWLPFAWNNFFHCFTLSSCVFKANISAL